MKKKYFQPIFQNIIQPINNSSNNNDDDDDDNNNSINDSKSRKRKMTSCSEKHY